MVSATLFYHFVRTTALGWGRSANIGAADTTTQEFPLGVSQILCKHHRAVKNRARIIYWGGGLSATPCIVSDIGDAGSSTNADGFLSILGTARKLYSSAHELLDKAQCAASSAKGKTCAGRCRFHRTIDSSTGHWRCTPE